VTFLTTPEVPRRDASSASVGHAASAFLDPTLTLDLPRRELRARFRVEWRMQPILEPLQRS